MEDVGVFSHMSNCESVHLSVLRSTLIQREKSQQLSCGTDIHDPRRVNLDDFGGPLVFNYLLHGKINQ